jgi:hypothetical protein
MITKETFTKYINRIQEFQEAEDKINLAGEILEFSISFAEHEQLIVNILEDVFDDRESNWISYFIYDLSFGNDWHEGCIREKDGTDISLRNAGELYDLLMSEFKEDY